MSVSIVQSATSQNGSATFSSPITSGNSVIVIAYANTTSSLVVGTSNVTLGGSSIANTQLLQGYESNNIQADCAAYGIWLLPNCPGGGTAVAWGFSLASAAAVTAIGTIAYEVTGLGSNPLATMGSRNGSANSSAIDSLNTGNLQFANELVIAASVTHAGAASASAGWTALNNGTNNCWAGYQVSSAAGQNFDWTQTAGASDYWAAGVISIYPNSAVTPAIRLFNNVNGPATAINYTGNFLAGVTFEVTNGDCWFEGYWWWVCGSGQTTTSTKCALWQLAGQGSGTESLIPGSVVTSGTLTAGQWNYIPLPTPVQLAIGTLYTAALAVNGSFPDTNNTWGTGQIYPAGITLGPLNCFGRGTNTSDYGQGQGVFTTGGSDPSLLCPQGISNTDNFWVDVQISRQTPSNYTGTYRLWPNNGGSQFQTSADSAVNYVIGTEIDVSAPCLLNKIWYYSPGGTVQLATECSVWNIANQQLVVNNTSPIWSGAAASGWVACSFNNVILPPGKYRVSVYNGAGTPDQWGPHMLYYWLWSGPAANGISSGPMYAPDTGRAQSTNLYQAPGTEAGQAVFAVGPPNQYPNTYVDNLYQNYWVDMEVTLAPASGLLLTSFI